MLQGFGRLHREHAVLAGAHPGARCPTADPARTTPAPPSAARCPRVGSRREGAHGNARSTGCQERRVRAKSTAARTICASTAVGVHFHTPSSTSFSEPANHWSLGPDASTIPGRNRCGRRPNTTNASGRHTRNAVHLDRDVVGIDTRGHHELGGQRAGHPSSRRFWRHRRDLLDCTASSSSGLVRIARQR